MRLRTYDGTHPCPHDDCSGTLVIEKSNASGKVKNFNHRELSRSERDTSPFLNAAIHGVSRSLSR